MRLEEICQLHCEDIYEENGIWIFDITTESSDGLNDKFLKTKNAIRQIPIHDKLIELGLLDYLDTICSKSPRLFPLLNKTEKTFKYGKQVGNQFSALVKARGIEGKKSFHSLRHTFDDFFKQDHSQEKNIFKQIFGHEITDLATNQYGSKYPPKQCYNEIISKLHYEGEE